MISSSRAQRLKRLEARAMPAVGQSMVIEVRFVCPVKGVTGSKSVHALESRSHPAKPGAEIENR